MAPKDSDILIALQLQLVICICRRLLILDKHLIALGAQNAQAGDCVCILHGSTVPHLLWPWGNESYELIGQCYVDGVMYGEAVSWPEDEASKFILVQDCHGNKQILWGSRSIQPLIPERDQQLEVQKNTPPGSGLKIVALSGAQSMRWLPSSVVRTWPIQ